VRKSVRAIGKLAIKIEPAAGLCIRLLLDLIATKVSYIVQEATVVFKNIFRRYPNQYESVITTLCENLDSLDESEAKAAMIWVIGQYADRIENADELLEDFLFTFSEEPVEVQLALLTATVKLFVQRPSKGQALVPKVLKWATEETDNPDLRDRGFMYWRLLSSDIQTQDPLTARRIIMGEKPPITAESEKLEAATLEEMCLNVGSLATIYLKPVSQVFRSARPRRLQESPALQKHQLPTTREEADVRRRMAQLSLQTSASQPTNPVTSVPGNMLASPEGNVVGTNGNAPVSTDAINAVDSYFAQSGTNGYVNAASQNIGQTMFSPADERLPSSSQNNSSSLLDL
jgi:AP-2 complex subunit beta-1